LQLFNAISAFVGDVDSGAVFIEQALLVNPNLAAGWYVSGWIKLFLGEPEAAIEHLARALRLSPFDPLIFKMHTAIAYAHLLAGRHDDASVAAENILRTRPNYLTAVRGAAASHALAGRLDRARTLMAHMRQRDCTSRISRSSYRFAALATSTAGQRACTNLACQTDVQKRIARLHGRARPHHHVDNRGVLMPRAFRLREFEREWPRGKPLHLRLMFGSAVRTLKAQHIGPDAGQGRVVNIKLKINPLLTEY
jgi:tetratricopeptide (TPR) repeat protein